MLPERRRLAERLTPREDLRRLSVVEGSTVILARMPSDCKSAMMLSSCVRLFMEVRWLSMLLLYTDLVPLSGPSVHYCKCHKVVLIYSILSSLSL